MQKPKNIEEIQQIKSQMLLQLSMVTERKSYIQHDKSLV